MPADFTGRRVLVVEDEMLIALMVEETLHGLGCEVVGPASRLDEALRLADAEALDAAVLDVNIRGGDVYPVAERLQARGVPFTLASGYGDWTLPPGLREQPRLVKPFSPEDVADRVRAMLGAVPIPS